MHGKRILQFSAILLAILFALHLIRPHWEKYLEKKRGGPLGRLAQDLNFHAGREACDIQLAPRRLVSAQVVDRFSAEIAQLWRERKPESKDTSRRIPLGNIELRVSTEKSTKGMDSSSWSWEEVYGLIQRTQSEPNLPDNADRWRDIDTQVRFLLQKDYSRQIQGKKFLTPEHTEHLFRPNPGVKRTGPREFTVDLDAGEFEAFKEVLENLLESEWRQGGYRVKIRWVKGGAYRFLARHDSSRSIVNHARRSVEIAHLAWTKTVAHELGHVLGFDDHYYNVWNERNCYYLQESRLSDLMSNSEHGKVMARHWEILNQAYPWKGPMSPKLFSYIFER